MIKITLIGRLTADPEITTVNGNSCCNFSVAADTRQKDASGARVPNFFRVAAWGKLGENCAKFLGKGKRVALVGNFSQRAYTDKNGAERYSLDVFAEEVEFIEPKHDEGAAPVNAPVNAAPQVAQTPAPQYQATPPSNVTPFPAQAPSPVPQYQAAPQFVPAQAPAPIPYGYGGQFGQAPAPTQAPVNNGGYVAQNEDLPF